MNKRNEESPVFVPHKTIMLIQCPSDDLAVYYGVIGFFTHHGFVARKGQGACVVKIEMIDHSKTKILEWDKEDWQENYFNLIKRMIALFPAIDQKNSTILSAEEIILVEKSKLTLPVA